MSPRLLVAALCALTVNAFRTKTDSKHSANCPPFADLQLVKGQRCMHMKSDGTAESVDVSCCEEQPAASGSGGCADAVEHKGRCVNFATGQEAPGCCGDSCEETLGEFQTVLRHRMQLYMTECHLLHSDVKRNDSGFLSVTDSTRLCSKACQDVEELSESVTYPDFSSLKTQCDLSLVEELEVGSKVLTTLDVGRGSCTGVEEGTDGICPDLSMATHDCGTSGSTEESCQAAGCCWNPTQDSPGRPWRDRPWCYKMASSVQCDPVCPNTYYDKTKREDCSAFLILDAFTHPDREKRGQACADVGCCWQPLEHGSKDPWCFYKPCLAV